MLNLSLKDNVRGMVIFQYYRQGSLWYKTNTGMLFPVPIEDTGDGQFNQEDRAMLYMRYIRRHIESMEPESS